MSRTGRPKGSVDTKPRKPRTEYLIALRRKRLEEIQNEWMEWM